MTNLEKIRTYLNRELRFYRDMGGDTAKEEDALTALELLEAEIREDESLKASKRPPMTNACLTCGRPCPICE